MTRVLTQGGKIIRILDSGKTRGEMLRLAARKARRYAWRPLKSKAPRRFRTKGWREKRGKVTTEEETAEYSRMQTQVAGTLDTARDVLILSKWTGPEVDDVLGPMIEALEMVSQSDNWPRHFSAISTSTLRILRSNEEAQAKARRG